MLELRVPRHDKGWRLVVLKTEIKAVVNVLLEAEDVAERALEAGEDPPTFDYVATRIIEDLDELRSKKSMVSIVARFSADNGKTWQFFLYGPYKSKAVAKQKSGGLFPPGSPLQVKWMVLDHVKDFRKEVLAEFKDTQEVSGWDKNKVPVELLSVTQWVEPITSEDEE